ncbi:MAG: 2-oxo acid dehydrogenase subunit E2 [Kiritimatiellae bacterium]|nr:2-oxo acid dehydrogenase subunit E2 [Kiritimatiellia bacterium]
MREHPELNASWEDDRIVINDVVNIGIAVDTDSGLLVPVLRDAPDLGLRELAAKTRDLAERARQRKLSPDEYSGGTFTVSNLGSTGVDAFTPIINYPECAVLGIGRIVLQPAVNESGAIVPRHMVWLSLTFDHRITDGVPAARFLDTIRKYVENPRSTVPISNGL